MPQKTISEPAEQAGNRGNDNEDGDHRNPDQRRADQRQKEDAGEQADDQQQKREAEWPDLADIDSMRAPALGKLVRWRPIRPAAAAAIRRYDLRLYARPLGLVRIFRHMPTVARDRLVTHASASM